MRACVLALATLLFLTGCQNAYYAALEKAGIHKRDLLVERVEDARDAQQQAKQQFQNALERYRSVVRMNGGELEKRYEALDAEYRASEASAREVRGRIAAVEEVADALFDEWKDELDDYSDPGLRALSAKELDRTRDEYADVLRRMRAAEQRIDPVLSVLHDRVLFLKHNLNAQAIGALQGENAGLQGNVDRLMRDMQRAIDEADAFIRRLQAGNRR